MRTCDYIARRLAQEGITHAFLVQGGCNNDLIYSIADTEGIEYVCAMHEQSAGFMAEAFAKVRGVPGCAIATSGPGGQNLVTAIANCFYDSVPAIFITGQVSTSFMRKSDGLRQLGFQEWPIVDCVKPITKRAVLVMHPDSVVHELERALHECRSGRPGPVLLDIPIDVQRGEITPTICVPQFTTISSIVDPDYDRFRYKLKHFVAEIVAALERAERPALLIGGGCSSKQARMALQAMSNTYGVPKFNVPMFPTWNALDIVCPDQRNYCGRIGTYAGAGRNFGIQNCDVLITVGCRISGRITGGRPETFARGARKYFIDIDAGLLDPRNQEVRADANLQCDAGLFLTALIEAWRTGSRPEAHFDWLLRCLTWRDRYDPVRPGMWQPECPDTGYVQHLVHPYVFARRLSKLLPDNAVIISDCGGNVVVMNHAFETKTGQRYFSNNGNSPMGFSFAAAIGAWFADPSRPVVCIIGDGGMNVNIQELQTLVNYGAKVKTFILDNRVYGITKAFQEQRYPGRYEACGPVGYRPPDFGRVVSAYGVRTTTLVHSDCIDTTIKSVMAYDEAAVCVVQIPEFHTYEPAIKGWGTPIEDMLPLLPREEFRANMVIEPMPGWETGDYK